MRIINHIILTLTLFLFFAGSDSSGIQAQDKKSAVAVLNFVNAGDVDHNEISILTDRFNNSLVTTGAFVVLEREKMDAILKEQNFVISDDCNSSECAVQVGQLLGVDIMVAGKVGKFGQMYTVDIRMIDVTSGEIVNTKSKNYKGEKEGLLGLIEEIAREISAKKVPAGKTGKSSKANDSRSDESLSGKQNAGFQNVSKTFYAGIAPGLNFPTGSLARQYHTNVGGNVSLGYHITSSFQTELETGYNTFKGDIDEQLSFIPIWLNCRYKTQTGKWQISPVAGIGYHRINMTYKTSFTDFDAHIFTFGFQGGFDFIYNLSEKYYLHLGPHYHIFLTKNKTFKDADAGRHTEYANKAFAGMNVGINMNFLP